MIFFRSAFTIQFARLSNALWHFRGLLSKAKRKREWTTIPNRENCQMYCYTKNGLSKNSFSDTEIRVPFGQGKSAARSRKNHFHKWSQRSPSTSIIDRQCIHGV